jgi:hypothetical protein
MPRSSIVGFAHSLIGKLDNFQFGRLTARLQREREAPVRAVPRQLKIA